MGTLRTLVALLCALATVAGTAAAQQATAVQTSLGRGLRVRVLAPELDPRPLVGAVEWVGRDTLVLRQRRSVVRVPLGAIERLQWSRGRRYGAGAVRGAGVGMLVGGVLLAGLSYATHDPDETYFSDSAADAASFGFAVGALVGVWPGAAVGVLTAPDRWRTMPLPRRDGAFPAPLPP